MLDNEFSSILDKVLTVDDRYPHNAYHFVRKALNFTTEKIQKKAPKGSKQDVSIPNLIQGISEYAHDQFGPLASCVFKSWGVFHGEDFGNIVFNLVEHGAFSKSDSDAREAFKEMLDFKEILDSPYLPAAERAKIEQLSSMSSSSRRRKQKI